MQAAPKQHSPVKFKPYKAPAIHCVRARSRSGKYTNEGVEEPKEQKENTIEENEKDEAEEEEDEKIIKGFRLLFKRLLSKNWN